MRSSRFVVFAAATLTFIVFHSASAQAAPVDSAHFKLAHIVVEKSGLGEATLDATFKSFPPEIAAQMPAGFIDSLTVRMKRILPQMLDSLAAVYARHFTSDELRQLSAFYDSPAGIKFAHESAPIQGEYMKSVQPMTMKVGQDLAQQLLGGGGQ